MHTNSKKEKEQGFRKTLLDTCCSTCPVHFHATAAFHTHHHMQHSLTDRPPTFFANSLGLSSFGAILRSWLLMSLSTAVNPSSPFWRWPFFFRSPHGYHAATSFARSHWVSLCQFIGAVFFWGSPPLVAFDVFVDSRQLDQSLLALAVFLFSNWLSCSHKFCSEAQGVSAVGG